MEFDTIAGLFISLLFVAYGGFSLLLLFNFKVRLWYLKRSERQRWRIMPVRKSDVQERRSLNEGVTLAVAIFVSLVFLPLGLVTLVYYFRQIVYSLLR